MDQIRINATPNRVVVSPTAPRIKIRLATGPQGPAGPPAEVYVQQTQPPTPQNVGAIWYETDANGNIQAEYVWDGNAWLPTPTGTGIASIIPVAPITATGQSVVSIGVKIATDTTPGVVARMATAGDVATAQPGPAVDAAVLKSVLPTNTSDFINDGDGVSGPFVDATAAGNAAPVQSLIAGNNIDIVSVGRDFTISAIPVPQHQSDWQITDTAAPGYIKNKPTNVSAFANDAGYITVADVGPNAPVQSVNGMTGAVVIDLSPYATNADLALTNAKFADYLPLIGGTISGGLTVSGAFNVGPAGTARVPTVAATDASTAVATTEWVQSLLAATGSIRFMWKYGGDTVNVDPGLGNLDINIGNTIIAISKTDGHGNQRYLDPIASGDTIVLTDDPATGPATEYQRFDVIGTPTDNGNWVSIPVSLAGGTSPTRVVGTPMRVTIGLDSQVATIEGVSAGYGLTGGGVSGVVTLAADLNVMAQLTDIPTVVSAFTNDAGYITAAGAPVQSVNTQTGVVVLATSDLTNDSGYITAAAIPTDVSAFTNDAGYITSAGAPVQSVNTQTGAVVLATSDLANDSGYITSAAIPTNVSAFTNDAGYITSASVPAKTSDLNNDGDGDGGGPFVDYADLSNELVDYLPLAGGTMTGNIAWDTGAAIGDASTANTFVVSTGGTERFRIDTTAITAKRQFLLQNSVDPAAPALAFGNYKTTGLYLTGVDDWAIANAGKQTMRMMADGRLQIGDKSNTAGCVVNVRTSLNVNAAGATTFLLQPNFTLSGGVPTVCSFYCQPTLSGSYTNYIGVLSAEPPGTATRTGTYKSFDAVVSGSKSYGYYVTNANNGTDTWCFFTDGGAPSYIQNLQLNAGVVTAPSLSFRGDTDTGLFSPAANTIAIATAGTERLQVGATGQITAAAGYTPTDGQDLATKAYVDAAPAQTTNISDGTAAAPALAFAADAGTGIFRETATGSFRVSVGGFSRFEIDTTGDCYTSGWMGVAVPDDATAALDVNGESIRIRQSVTPANATATGNAGEIMWDANYLYVCVATNTWKRVALSSW